MNPTFLVGFVGPDWGGRRLSTLGTMKRLILLIVVIALAAVAAKKLQSS